ncbi:zinc-binding dehydrogenase [Nocardia huaxiensis]|uniref:Zinc-binding dehydrogenase n=1 Tax=Nocardia huaxiensis TaxID=2755382 RepID=A0A7D6VEQ8_9NOCA|nr:zinc-binding dehydrogenase [Nocardia huaxiensis]QLY33333.1 zinc-binding dehydrogenase [Nocardia huaxiensis]UFS99758.1 zinc-binding dehydrogenase [Nocardia huaxiensis]
MRAVEVKAFGDPEVLTVVESPDPVPGPGEVVIEVAAADVMFLDTLLRSGAGARFFPVEPPFVPGGAIAGVVGAVGSGVDPAWVGRRVASNTAASGIGGGLPIGGYAEKALAREEQLTQVPAEVELTQAVALVHDGRTALAVFDRAAVQPGEWVLITAAAGGLGTLLIQLARAAGARVIAAARGEKKLALAQRLGAHEVVDYSEPGWADRVREATGGVQVILDGAGGPIGVAALAAASPGARFIGYGNAAGGFAPIAPETAAAQRVTVVPLFELTAAEVDWTALFERALTEAASGRLEVVIGHTFPLDHAGAAHAAIAARETFGRTILTV